MTVCMTSLLATVETKCHYSASFIGLTITM